MIEKGGKYFVIMFAFKYLKKGQVIFTKKIGVIGLGRMGFGIAKNLMNREYDVIGYDISPEAREQFHKIGGTTTDSCVEAARDADVVVFAVFDAAQFNDVLFVRGVAKVMRAGSQVIVMSSVGKKVIEAAAPILEEMGIDLVDAPMKGSAKDAGCGNLSLMVAASPKAIKEVDTLLNSIGSVVCVVGDKPGMGQMVKTCVQTFFCMACEGACEIMALAKAAGLDEKTVYDVLASTGAASDVFKTTTKFIGSRCFFGTGNPISILRKDLAVALDISEDYGLSIPAVRGMAANITLAANEYPDDDIWAAVLPVEKSAGIEIKMEL